MFTKPPRPQGRGGFLCAALPRPASKKHGPAEDFRGAVFCLCFQFSGCALGEGAGSGVGVGSGVGSGGLMTTRSLAM